MYGLFLLLFSLLLIVKFLTLLLSINHRCHRHRHNTLIASSEFCRMLKNNLQYYAVLQYRTRFTHAITIFRVGNVKKVTEEN